MTEDFTPAPPPAGWFPDPAPDRRYRWWDGRSWTTYVYRPDERRTDVAVQPSRSLSPTPPADGAHLRARKWLGRYGGWIITASFTAVWVYYFAVSLALTPLERPVSDPGAYILDPMLLLTGSSAAAIALFYTMAYRIQPQDRLSVPYLIIVALVGGACSGLLAAPLNSLISWTTGGSGTNASTVALALAGAVEELMKVALVIILAWRLPRKTARTGLFVGASVGFGFAVFENIQYVESAWARGLAAHNPIGQVVAVVLARQVLAVLGHPVWTALLSAAVFAAARNGRFRLSVGVIGAYAGVAAAHSLYDSANSLMTPFLDKTLAALLSLPLMLMVLAATGLIWLRVARRARAADLGAGRRTEPAFTTAP